MMLVGVYERSVDDECGLGVDSVGLFLCNVVSRSPIESCNHDMPLTATLPLAFC